MKITNDYRDLAVEAEDTAKKSGTVQKGEMETEPEERKFKNVHEYSKYLQGKYPYMNAGTVSMEGIPTTVTVFGVFLEKCMKNPKKAAFLEENLAVLPDCAKKTVISCLGTIVSQNWTVDENGNISSAISGTSDPDGKIARENAKRKAGKRILFYRYRKQRRKCDAVDIDFSVKGSL